MSKGSREATESTEGAALRMGAAERPQRDSPIHTIPTRRNYEFIKCNRPLL